MSAARTKRRELHEFRITFICRGRPFSATVNAVDSQEATAKAAYDLARSCSEFDYATAQLSCLVEL